MCLFLFYVWIEREEEGEDAAEESDDMDGLPFACHLCREPFTKPVVTRYAIVVVCFRFLFLLMFVCL